MGANRNWTEEQLHRMREALEGGIFPSIVAERFQCAYSTVCDLAVKHGWTVTRRGAHQTVVMPPRRRTSRGYRRTAPNRPAFVPTENGCPVRTLEGAELEYWRGVYMAREQDAAARKAVFG